MQTLNVLLIFALSILQFIPDQSQSTVICSFAGTDAQLIPSWLTVENVPQRCKIVVYGFYNLDIVNGNQIGASRTDIVAINLLITGHKTVYLRVTFSGAPQWIDIMNSFPELNREKSLGRVFDQYMKPMEEFVKKHRISGVILDPMGLFNGLVKPNYASKMKSFIQQLKKDVPGLVVGVLVNGYEFDYYTRRDLFNFATVNPVVDHYIIDMVTTVLTCNAAVAKTGRLPQKVLENVTAAVKRSGMAHGKTVINYFLEITVVDKQSKKSGKTYTEYCQAIRDNTTSDYTWCKDTPKLLYDQAYYARDKYAGIMLSYLDYDDYDGECCSYFTVTNIFLDAWENISFTDCSKLAS